MDSLAAVCKQAGRFLGCFIGKSIRRVNCMNRWLVIAPIFFHFLISGLGAVRENERTSIFYQMAKSCLRLGRFLGPTFLLSLEENP
jgi:hypothetical protein